MTNNFKISGETGLKSSRNSTVELLRFIFMFLIVLLHVYVHGTGLDYEQIYNWGEDWNTAFHLSLFSLAKIGVTGFIFISGFYGIHSNKHKVIDLVLITLFYSIILNSISDNKIGILNFFHPFDIWWFISAYLFLMFIAPLIEIGIKNISEKSFRNIVVAIALYVYFARALSAENAHNVCFLLTVYLIARYFRLVLVPRINNHKQKVLLRFIGISSILLLIIIPVLASEIHLQKNVFNLFIQNNNPLLLVASGWLVYESNNNKFYNKKINRFMTSILAIYIITDFPNIRSIFTKNILPEVLNGVGFLYIFFICLVCLIIDQVRIKIFFYGYKFFKAIF